ncbi:hypothetical protein ULMS_01050 [Patiriisocius marinistellae]|uniref:DUF3127 domain-containing protein n=1 Tax=Patiriisocius marinistellae TaxID=2494560 RepID=A0A5J4FRY7_9FLAO|nr:DUF3127 domain-containing protein [Patiriisocius marinistellae]GEQ84597.1 hypothetical protein ULMS_01050 [Patiriisocius marinistellae]
MEVQGKVKLVGETQTFGSNGFRKRELVVTTEEQYPQHIMIEFVQDKTDLLNSVAPGQDVKVSINLRGREWLDPKTNTNRYFNSVQGWRIENVSQGAPSGAGMPPMPPADAFEPVSDLNDNQEDDLPF